MRFVEHQETVRYFIVRLGRGAHVGVYDCAWLCDSSIGAITLVRSHATHFATEEKAIRAAEAYGGPMREWSVVMIESKVERTLVASNRDIVETLATLDRPE